MFEFQSGVAIIPEDIKRDLLTRKEVEVFDKLLDDEKKEVFASLDVESVIISELMWASPLSTLRLLVRCLEEGKQHLPEITHEAIDSMRNFFFRTLLEAMELASQNKYRCSGCGEIHEHESEDDGHQIN